MLAYNNDIIKIQHKPFEKYFTLNQSTILCERNNFDVVINHKLMEDKIYHK